MSSLSLVRAAELIGARHLGADAEFSSVSTDTRALEPGHLFVALQGPRFDGHDYLGAAQQRGAAGAMVSRPTAADLPLLQVSDTRRGLGDLAGVWRRRFGRILVAVTGSNGKTTVKEMLSAILSRRGRVLATAGNLNNDVGVPLTLLRIQEEDFAVVEMGANHPGEIGYLSRLAEPDVAVVNNVGAAHLEGFGTLEAVARAKGEIAAGLSEQGVLVINGDDPWASSWRSMAKDRRVVSFGMAGSADVRTDPEAVELRWRADGFRSGFPLIASSGRVDIELSLGGMHNVMNALAAATAAMTVGASLEDVRLGLAAVRPVRGRLQTRLGPRGLRIIDDTYNANPDSVAAAVRLLASAPGERWLVLGDLAELGPEAEALHRRLGVLTREVGIERLFTVGVLSRASAEAFGPGASHFPDQAGLLERLGTELPGVSCILVKGSRSAGMERVVDALAAPEEA